MRASPLRAVALSIQATSALVGATVQTAATAAGSLGTVASTGLTMAAIPVREGVKALSDGLPAPTFTRHSWRGKGRAWIEVRGLDGPGGAELASVVVDAVLACPGVTSASLNRPLSRVVVSLAGDQTSLRELCRAVDNAEKHCRSTDNAVRSKPLPGDGLLLATKAVGVGA
ncbi:MAG TPA: heavy-metal-associated domain-containing protein, partial [Mycobacterium sp.]|nr:heavy-metal-associated domain-containing protein [Mycobacterium sp.]